MGCVYVPLAELGSLVLIEAVVNTQRNFAARHGVRKVEIGGGVVGGIASENNQQIDFAAAHVGDEFFDRLGLVDRIGVDRVGIENRLAEIAELGVDRMGESVKGRRLVVANENDARSGVALQLLPGPRDQSTVISTARLLRADSRHGDDFVNPQLRRQGTSQNLSLVRPYRKAMIRLGSRRRRRALDHVQAVHGRIGIAAAGEVADVFHVAGESGVEEVGVEGDDYVGLREIVAGLDRLAEGQLRAFEDVVAIHRLVDVPLGLRINLQEVAQLVGERGRRNRWGQNADACALQRFLRAERAADCAQKCRPRALVAHRHYALRAIGIVEAENRSLRKDVGAAERCRMLIVAFDLCGASQMTFD